MILAQLNGVDPKNLADFITLGLALLGAAGLVGGIVFGILQAVRRNRPTDNRISPQPLLVREDTTWVDVRTWEREHNHVLQRLASVEQKFDTIQTSISEQGTSTDNKLGTIHRRVDQLLKITYQLAGKVGIQEPAADPLD